ncbi:hypothetical protein [Mycetocola saprophilus]|uniref:hypothetical protein n=1 Tax=Mycetocola saprophilus TaxID=76636 RepID=UPI003BEF67A7
MITARQFRPGLDTLGSQSVPAKGTVMHTTQAAFSSELLPVEVISEAENFELNGPAVILNLSPAPARIEVPLGGMIQPLRSTILTSGTRVSGKLLAVLGVPCTTPTEAELRLLGWEDFYDSRSPTAPPGTAILLRSVQDRVGRVAFNRAEMLGDVTLDPAPVAYEIRLNLWFSPAHTDCGIHREHNFIETHTQIAGMGRMQKFSQRSHASLFEDQRLAPGQTQPSLFGCWDRQRIAYPWHQYRADTDVVWLAVEYHALGGTPS